MTAAIAELEQVCERLRHGGVPIRTWCGTRYLPEPPNALQLIYGVEVDRLGDNPPSLNVWIVDRRDQIEGLELAARESLRLIGDGHRGVRP
jgi:hypothetical protein